MMKGLDLKTVRSSYTCVRVVRDTGRRCCADLTGVVYILKLGQVVAFAGVEVVDAVRRVRCERLPYPVPR